MTFVMVFQEARDEYGGRGAFRESDADLGHCYVCLTAEGMWREVSPEDMRL